MRAQEQLAAADGAPVKGLRMSGERVELTRPVQRDGERLGTIYLEARYDVWGRIAAYLGHLRAW